MNVLYPVFAMFALTAFCLFRLASLRFAAVRRGEIDPRFFKLYRNAEEPDKLRVYSRHLSNLFEAPVLFYVIAILAFSTQQTGLLPLCLAWAYVVLRYAHSYVHLTSNHILTRFRLFALSWLVLAVLWLVIFAGIVMR
ncbi:MAG: MAPEG family protein [Woeseia sp.]